MGRDHPPVRKLSRFLGHRSVEIVEAHTSGPMVSSFLTGRRPAPSFLGVSIRNKMANRRYLAVLIPWLLERSERTKIVIGDYIHRLNFMALEGLPANQATRKALKIGQQVRRYVQAIVGESQSPNTVEILSSAAITETPECQHLLKGISTYYDSDGLFSNDVERELMGFLSRMPSHLRPQSQAHNVLKDYILEEVAMFSYLYKNGFTIEVYPGPDLRIMQNIVSGIYPDFPFKGRDRTHISVKVQKQTSDLENDDAD